MQDFISHDKDGIEVTIITKTYGFHNNSIHPHNRRMRTEYFGRDKLVETGGDLYVYANGLGKKNEGHVSIRLFHFDGVCIVSLIDASENQTLSQSFILSQPKDRAFKIDQYISHKKLLSDPDDLLPNGILTLKIYARLTWRYLEYWKVHKIYRNISLNFRPNTDGWELLLDSPLFKRLSENSNAFVAMQGTAMIENRTKSMYIRKEEIATFLNIGKMLMGYNPLVYKTIKQIFDMYIFADKYDIPFVSETCTCFLKLYLSVHSTDVLFETADKYFKDEHLKELITNQVTLISETNFDEEIDKTDISKVSFKQPVHECLWVYTNPGETGRFIFHNKNTAMKFNLRMGEDEEFDFYN